MSLIGRIVRFVKTAGAMREEDTERDGFLSYKSETHALGHGLYDGMKSLRPAPKELPDNVDVQREKHYYKGGYFVGTILQLGIVVVAGKGLL